MKPTPEKREPDSGHTDRRPRAASDLAESVRRHFREARAAALSAGEALGKAQQLVNWDAWDSWLEESCGLSAASAQRLVDHAADQTDHVPEHFRMLSPLQERRVVCGWCKWQQAQRGLPAKHVSGLQDAGWVVHGACSECQEAVDRLVGKHFEPPPAALNVAIDSTTEEDDELRRARVRPYAVPHVNGWARAQETLRFAFFHLDQVRDALGGLLALEEVGVTEGLQDAVREAEIGLEGVTRLAAELILISSGTDYDDGAFGDSE